MENVIDADGTIGQVNDEKKELIGKGAKLDQEAREDLGLWGD